MRKQGFTLIELLIVIAIVAIIAAIIFPVFFTARERGRRAVCQSNLRQLAIAMQMYVHDNDGQFPLPNPLWYEAILPNVGNKQVFACPDNPQGYSGPIPLFDTGRIDYGYDIDRLGVFFPPYPTKKAKGIAEASLPAPSVTWLNADESWTDGDGTEHYFRMVKASCGPTFQGNTLHSGGGNYSFVDGHVEWLTPEQYGATECAAGPLPAPFKG